MKIKIRNNNTVILYGIFFAHLISILINGVYNPMVLLFTYLYIIYIIVTRKIRIVTFFCLEVVILSIYLVTGYKYGTNISELVFLITLVLLRIYVKEQKIQEKKFVKFVNMTYIIYLALSILVYLGIISPVMIGRNNLNIFSETFLGINVKTLVGFAGSTADIDTYSGLVFIINLTMNKEKNRLKMMVLSFVSLLLTFRMTPIVAIVGVSIYIVLSLDYISSVFSKSIYLVTGIACLFSFTVSYIFRGTSIDFESITHARSIMWNQYVEIMLYKEKGDLIWGSRHEIPRVSINWGEGWTSNPHSSYLQLFLVIGIIFIIFYFNILFKSSNCDVKFRAIMIYILFAAITNSTIFYLGNPIYIIVIYYLIYSQKNNCRSNLTYKWRK